jgi:phosphoribosylformylglycinamidine synthase
VELAMLSLMWSEHCAYKHSKKLLRRLPTDGPHVLMGPGENAGVVDVGGGMALAFKVESHNHPSAVEPFQGAATGVGGILRDVFAVGARPVAVLDSLRFGEPHSSQRSRYLLDRAVAGIGHYGNSIGVPTIGGELYFERSYEHNCLVNAMCLGVAPRERLIRSAAVGPGNVLVLLGALTGRDGIGGASVLASAEFGDGDEDKRPSVQIGDPFAEKKLLECCLELLDRELLASLQDLGAAGLTSSASEMASKGEVGLELDVSRVPLREPGMEPFEIMVSESQERMLCVVEPRLVGEVCAVCEKWETLATPIGQVTDSGRLRVLDGGRAVADLPVGVLVDDCPLYDLEPVPPAEPIYPAADAVLTSDESAGDTLIALLGSANLASRLPVFEQYDAIVQSRTARRPQQADAAVLALEHGVAIAVSIDGNGRRVACDPRVGTAEAVYECAANLACSGAEPLGLTNCLNFGNPEKPHVAWQLVEAVEGMAGACRALEVPVVGGNVSLYNEAPSGPIFPTPVVGMVGRLPDPERGGRLGFAAEGDVIALVGTFEPSLRGSELAKLRGEAPAGPLPGIDIDAAREAHASVRDAVRAGMLSSAHDIAEGGIAVAIAESCIGGGIGATVKLPEGVEPFAEAPGRAFIVSYPVGSSEPLGTAIGTVGGERLAVEGLLDVPLDDLRGAWEAGLT